MHPLRRRRPAEAGGEPGGALRQFRFLLPSLDEQHRIVAYLDDLQAQVDELTAIQDATQAELEALLPSVLERSVFCSVHNHRRQYNHFRNTNFWPIGQYALAQTRT